MRQFIKSEKAKIYTKTALGIAATSVFAIIISQAFVASPAIGQAKKKAVAAPKASGQRVVAAPVNYWMDMSNGGESMMPRMPFGGGANNSNNFWDAYSGSTGKHTDIALFHKDFPRAINANQAVPRGARIGTSIPLIPNEVTTEVDHDVPEMPKKQGNLKISFYWGCGANVRQGQPRIFEIRNGDVTAYSAAMQSRGERDRGAGQNQASSRWPNQRDHKSFNKDSTLIGTHTLSGTNVPASLSYAIDVAHDFMGDLGLSSSGDKSGNINFTWNSVQGARAYFVNAMGMKGENENSMEMILWSSAEVPDPGYGLLNYLSPSNITRYLQERAILPPTQTTCMVPRAIFANTQMIMARGIGYGDEQNIVYPARPTDSSIPWIQEWTARFRNKTMSTLMVGMPGMGGMMGAGMSSEEETSSNSSNDSTTNQTNNNNDACEQNRQTGRGLGSALGRGLGQYRAGALGRIAGDALGGVAGQTAAGRTSSCQQQNQPQPKGN